MGGYGQGFLECAAAAGRDFRGGGRSVIDAGVGGAVVSGGDLGDDGRAIIVGEAGA
jgi:hypothetical protein